MSASVARSAFTPQLIDTAMMAILRSHTGDHVPAVAVALAEAGVTCMELTLTIPDAGRLLEKLATLLPPEVALGMGTVTTAAQAEHAADAGAKFLVCPGLCPGVVEVAAVRGIPCYPGAWTPSEVMTAWDSGATAVKLFPAASGGPAHLRRIRDPLPDVPLIPTGGVGLAEVREYLVSGAIAVGLGSPLIGDALEGGDLGALRARVQWVHAEVAAARETR